MTEAPSIKEALELKPCPFCGSEITHIESLARSFDPPRVYHEWHHKDDNADCPIRAHGKIVCVSTENLQASKKYRDAWNTRATLSPPAGERRDAIARMIDPVAFNNIGLLAKGRQRVAFEATDRLLAPGLVQDEAAIRADEREKCATIADVSAAHCDEDTPGGYCAANQARSIALAIRSARDGGAES